MPLSTYLNLGLGELAHTKLTVKLADRTVKYLKGIAENMLVGIGKFVFPIDFTILDMPEDIKVPLILRRPFLSTTHAKIYLRRDHVDNLLPIIKEDGVVEEFGARNDARMVSKVFGYPSNCDHDKKIHIDCAHNLKLSCMIVLEDMDAYRDEGMGDVIFGEPFLREVGINAKRFEGIITIYNGNEKVTYQMVRSHSRFKHHTNEQCNKISHSYQKIESFYKGVLNLGPEYVRDAEIKEWLTRGNISVYEMK
ncbi:glycosyl transferase, family 8 protein [Tanacetum coccineum]